MWFLIGMAVMLGIVVLVGLLWWIVKKCRTPAEGYNQLLTA
jgi:Tfp pilus assembly protein PilN